MALQTSGAISFANLQTELGGSNPITMGEYAAFRVSGSGNTISMNQFYGASSSLDSIDVTVGYRAAAHPTYAGPWYGYANGSSGFGSINPTSVAWNSGATYSELNASNPPVYSGNYYLRVATAGGTYSNSGWTTVTVSGVTYSRTNFTYSTVQGRQFWSLIVGTTSPFGTTVSATKTVVFN